MTSHTQTPAVPGADGTDEGLAAADTGLAHCRATADRLFEAELWRLRGELVLRRTHTTGQARSAAIPEAKECFEKARAVAVSQGARMFEQRVSHGLVGAAGPRTSR